MIDEIKKYVNRQLARLCAGLSCAYTRVPQDSIDRLFPSTVQFPPKPLEQYTAQEMESRVDSLRGTRIQMETISRSFNGL